MKLKLDENLGGSALRYLEQAGYDVGFEKGLLDWIVKHRSEWRMNREKEIAKEET